jgi:hypothetical protein
VIRSVGASGKSFRFRFAAIKLAQDIGANAPERLLVGLGFLAFAVSAFVRRAKAADLLAYELHKHANGFQRKSFEVLCSLEHSIATWNREQLSSLRFPPLKEKPP